jgi:ABC-2 type transport system permease protein
MSGRTTTDAADGAPTWWLVFTHELHDLWVGGKAPVLLLIFAILVGVMTWVMASNSELSLIPPQEMVYETLKAAIAVALFMSLIIGADSISGERERSTLEGLLLTPTSRREIVVGKFLAGISPWPFAMLIVVPYMHVLAQGDPVFWAAMWWGAIVGTLLAPAFTGVGMLTSFWSNSNRTSLFWALGLYVLFLLPSQLPTRTKLGFAGSLMQQVNPISAGYHFLSNILENSRSLAEWWPYLIAPSVMALLVYIVLFGILGPGLRLEGDWTSLRLLPSRRRATTAAALLVALLAGTSSARAGQAAAGGAHAVESGISIKLDQAYSTVKMGDKILFSTEISNTGQKTSRGVAVAMNIINLNPTGDVVDPEDWSPQRTQYLGPLDPGTSQTLDWRVNAILDGDYLVYMVAIPEPEGKEATSLPVSSSGIHLTVTPFSKLTPAQVLPYAIGGPMVLLVGVLLIYRARRRAIDAGAG